MRVLIAEDDATSRIVLEATLKTRGYDVVAVADGEAALTVLREDNPPRIALLDWLMPSTNGIEVCRQIRARDDSAENYIFIILLTGKRNTEEIIQGLEAGADDYVTKPYNPEELQLRIQAGQRVIDLQDELLQTQRALKLQADHDALTGVLNRGAISTRAEEELARAIRAGTPLALAMMDIDHFKQINDSHGHQVGDEVLKETVNRLRGETRPYDILGRYGGEEFLLVLPGLEPGEGALLDRLRESICIAPMETGKLAVPVAISVGLAWATGEQNLEALIRAADEALYAAKAGGRNRVVCAEPPALD